MDSDSLARFFSKVDFGDKDNSCWIWLASVRDDGYGQFEYNGSICRVHRLSYEHFYGPIPKGMIVRHKTCDNPLCVNPLHLTIGDHQDNMNDMVSHGRQSSKITHDDAMVIRQLYDTKAMNQYEIAGAFDIAQSQVSRIVNRQNWQ